MNSNDSIHNRSSASAQYKVKNVRFPTRQIPILLQNQNGPCPLISICNVLLLRGEIRLPSDNSSTVVAEDRLLHILAEYLVEKSQSSTSDAHLNHNIQEALDLLPKLKTGLDVNPKFSGVDRFEATAEISIFDVFGIPLYHGWLIDPADEITASVIGDESYNQVVERLVAYQTSTATMQEHDPIHILPSGTPTEGETSDEARLQQDSSLTICYPTAELSSTLSSPPAATSTPVSPIEHRMLATQSAVPQPIFAIPEANENIGMDGTASHKQQEHLALTREGLVIQQFLQENASQLTVYGLQCLHERIADGEFCVLFRNNHFSTLYKHRGELFTLCTDEGFSRRAVWEKLAQTDGDSVFYDVNFQRLGASQRQPHQRDLLHPYNSPVRHANPQSDYEYALRLQRAEQRAADRRRTEELDREDECTIL